MTPAIELHDIAFEVEGQRVLRDVDLSVQRGANVVVCGCSGSGKSTLLGIIAGLRTPSQGSVQIGGEIASVAGRIAVPPFRRGIGMVFQDLGLWPNLTVVGNIFLGLAGSKWSRGKKRAAVEQAVASCQLSGLEGRRPYQLSGGEQQRLALARAIASSPGILLLDEPFGSLDLLLKNNLADLVVRLAKQLGTTVITVVHDPSDALALQPENIVVVEDGCIKESVSLPGLASVSPESRILAAWQVQLRRVGGLRPNQVTVGL